MSALLDRIIAEEKSKEQKCACIGCDNKATHTWSGHPTCDDCGIPSRNTLDFPILHSKQSPN